MSRMMCKFDPNQVCRDEFLNKSVIMDDCEHCPSHPEFEKFSFRETIGWMDAEIKKINNVLDECMPKLQEGMKLLVEKMEKEKQMKKDKEKEAGQ